MTDIEFYVGDGAKISRSKVFKCLKRIFNFKNLFTTHNSQFTKAIAFTLAETLIVMGIIGVVAALTLPNLNSSTGDREKVAKVKKIYQNLNDAHGRLEAIYGKVSEWNCEQYGSFGECYHERLSDVLKVSKSCKNKDACFSIGIHDETGDGAGVNFAYLLSDGMHIINPSMARNTKRCLHEDCLHFKINISGKTYVGGKDIFKFELDPDKGIVTPYFDGLYAICAKSTNRINRSECTGWVIDFGNMDYLKTDSSGKCKNNDKITLDGVNNTTCK